jgi:hypothetical protein
MSTEDILSEDAAPAEALRHASSNHRYGRAALFAAAACVLGMLGLLVAQLGWWSILAAPAYLAATALAAMLARGRVQALLAVALSTASMGVLVALVKLVA